MVLSLLSMVGGSDRSLYFMLERHFFNTPIYAAVLSRSVRWHRHFFWNVQASSAARSKLLSVDAQLGNLRMQSAAADIADPEALATKLATVQGQHLSHRHGIESREDHWRVPRLLLVTGPRHPRVGSYLPTASLC